MFQNKKPALLFSPSQKQSEIDPLIADITKITSIGNIPFKKIITDGDEKKKKLDEFSTAIESALKLIEILQKSPIPPELTSPENSGHVNQPFIDFVRQQVICFNKITALMYKFKLYAEGGDTSLNTIIKDNFERLMQVLDNYYDYLSPMLVDVQNYCKKDSSVQIARETGNLILGSSAEIETNPILRMDIGKKPSQSELGQELKGLILAPNSRSVSPG